MGKKLGQNPKKRNEQQSESTKEQEIPASEIPPTIVGKSGLPPNIPPTPECNNESNNNSQPIKLHLPNWCEKWTLLIEILGLIGLIVYCVYTIKEWRTFDSERKTMEDESRQSQTNFNLQMDEARKQRELDERAWIFVAVPNSALDTNAGTLYLTIRNIGKTPALVTSLYGHWTTDRSEIPPHDPIGTNHSFMLIPNRETTLRLTVPIDETMQILNDANIYQYGTVYYSDIFGSNHWSQFCFYFSERGRLMVSEEYHNSCDDLDVKR